MRRIVIDTNYMQDPGLEAYLAAAPDNFALISQITMIEIHKKAAKLSARKAMEIACKFPNQIVILKDMVDFSYMQATTSPVMDLVDHDQSATFDQYCLTMVAAPSNDEIEARFRLHEAESAQFIADQGATAVNLYKLFEVYEPAFTEEEVDQIRKRVEYSGDLQRRIVAMAFDIRRRLIETADAEASKFPNTIKEAVDTYLFRFALVVALYFMRWVKANGRGLESPNKLTNQMLDMKIAAIATFFDGLLTRESNLHELYEEAVAVIVGLQGCVRCGAD